jgi:hypothetical protein
MVLSLGPSLSSSSIPMAVSCSSSSMTISSLASFPLLAPRQHHFPRDPHRLGGSALFIPKHSTLISFGDWRCLLGYATARRLHQCPVIHVLGGHAAPTQEGCRKKRGCEGE